MVTGPDELRELRETWDRLGRDDPFWAILTENDRRGGRWDPREFMATGREEFDTWLSWLGEFGLTPRDGRALDFGCGAGRMTQALARHFRSVDGVDIAPSMVALAEATNQSPSVRFFHHDQPDLSLFPDGCFDLVYSMLVLQHIRPEFTRRYLREFARVLAPGGILAFQLPGERQTLPNDAFSGHIEFDQPPPRTLSPGERVTIAVRVTNTSPVVWALGQVYAVGNHWRRGGQVLSWDDGRAWLPNLGPGESAAVDIEVAAPVQSGPATLQLDLVAEGIAWFSQRGCGTIEAPAVIEGRPRRGSPDIASEAPAGRMEMHCIPSAEVVRLLSAGGFDGVRSRVSNRSSPWIDHWYAARRSNSPLPWPSSTTTAYDTVGRSLRRWLPGPVKRVIRAGLRVAGRLP